MKKEFKALLRDYLSMLTQLEDAFTTKLLLWVNKCRAMAKDVQIEQQDINSYIEKDFIPFIRRQRKRVEKILKRLKEE